MRGTPYVHVRLVAVSLTMILCVKVTVEVLLFR